ncbi:MAG: AI-2E family transporter [Acidimicrobiales bacterium]
MAPSSGDMPAGRSHSSESSAETHPLDAAWAVPRWLERATGWTWRLLVLAVGVVGLIWILGLFRLVLVPVLIALLFSALFWPLSDWLRRHGAPPIVATWIVMLLGAGLLVGVGYLIFVTVGQQLTSDTQWGEIEGEIRNWLQSGPLDLTSAEIDDLEDRAGEALTAGIAGNGLGPARTAVELLGAGFLTLVLLFFFLKDGPLMWKWITRRIRPPRRPTVDIGGHAAFDALGAYMRGVAITGVVDATFIGIALVVIGVPLALPLAVLTFFAAFFPIVGATTAGALAALVALVSNGLTDAIIVVIVTFVVQQVEGDVIMPLVMRRQVHLHPAVILTVLAIGGALAGITGALVAVPIAAMVTAGASAIRGGVEAADGPSTIAPDVSERDQRVVRWRPAQPGRNVRRDEENP